MLNMPQAWKTVNGVSGMKFIPGLQTMNIRSGINAARVLNAVLCAGVR